jgi:hypothetical protein
MKKLPSFLSTVVIITWCFLPQQSFSQPDFSDDLYYSNKVTYEIGASLGVMNSLTDLGGGKGIGKKFVKDINLGNTKATGSIFLSAVYKYAVAVRLEAVWGGVKAEDAVLKRVKESVGGRYERNLSFRSSISEVSAIMEIHPRYFKNFTAGQKLPRISPYLLGGIGYFSFKPQGKLNGEWIDLKPLSTEGQGFPEYAERKPYKLKQFNLPVGAGIKYKLNEIWNVSAECVYRILNTDYLDDVSSTYIDNNLFQKYFNGDQLAKALALSNRQKELNPSHITNTGDIRGNYKGNDAYFSVNFKVALIF